MTDPRNRILLPLHTRAESNEFGGLAVDVAPLFLHLLLFETVILRSIRLADIAKLIRVLGASQTIELIEDAGITIRTGVESLGALTQKAPVVQFIHLYPPDPEAELSQMMRDAFSPLAMPRAVNRRLKRLIARRRLTSEPAHTGIGPAAERKSFAEAVTNSDVFNRALQATAQRWGNGLVIAPGAIHCQFDGGNLRFDAGAVQGNADVIADVMRRTCLALARLHTELGHMARDNAVTALDDESTALLEAHVAHIYRTQNPSGPIDQFARVLEAANLPDFETTVNERGIDIGRFLQVRDTEECRQFRAFLTSADALNPKELRDRVTSLRTRFGNMLQTGPGRFARLFVTTAVGWVVAGPIAGAAAGFAADYADSFLLEKIFPRSGIVSFIGQEYPTIFRG